MRSSLTPVRAASRASCSTPRANACSRPMRSTSRWDSATALRTVRWITGARRSWILQSASMIDIHLFLPEVWSLLGGVMALQGQAYREALAFPDAIPAAVAIVLAAGLSEAVGQSIVLFANRVKPARFIFSLFVDALLFTFGYVFLVLSTWLVCRLPGAPHLSLLELALVLGMSYAPMLFAFLAALPYLGSALMNLLRVWHFLAMVVGVAAAGGIDVFASATYVWLGWLVMMLVQRSFGKPI